MEAPDVFSSSRPVLLRSWFEYGVAVPADPKLKAEALEALAKAGVMAEEADRAGDEDRWQDCHDYVSCVQGYLDLARQKIEAL
jgi:hypothetical protein